MPLRIVANAIPGDDKAFVAKVREAIKALEGHIEWGDAEQGLTLQRTLRETYPDAEVMVKEHPVNPPVWDLYRDGGPRRVQLE
jgi:hypothetical protein